MATGKRGKGVRKQQPRRRANNTGTIFYRADRARWIAEVTIDGKSRSRSAQTKEEAEQYLAILLRGVDEHALVDTDRQTLGQFLADWLTRRQVRGNLRARTYLGYRAALRHVVDEIGMIPLGDVRARHIERMYDHLTEHLAPNTLAVLHTTFKLALSDAVRLELLPSNPALQVNAPRRTIRPGRRHLTVTELAALLAVAHGTQRYALWAVMALQGLRIGEALALRWGDIDRTAGLLRVDETLTRDWDGGQTTGPPKTETSGRLIPLGETVRAALAAHQVLIGDAGWTWGPDDWVFPSRQGCRLHPATVGHQLMRDCEAAGLEPITPHILRHTCATLHMDAGTSHLVVKSILGHASIQMTVDLYGHVDTTMQEAAMARMDDRLREAK